MGQSTCDMFDIDQHPCHPSRNCGQHDSCFLQEAQPGKRQYADSIESLVRNNIQKMKIDMANEVIDAGRFDMQTSMEERKQTLEALLQVRLPCLPFTSQGVQAAVDTICVRQQHTCPTCNVLS